MSSGEDLRNVELDVIIGVPLEVNTYIYVGDSAIKRLVRLNVDDVVRISGDESGTYYSRTRLDTDESIPESERRSILVPVDRPAIKTEGRAEHSFFEGALTIHSENGIVTVDGVKVELTDKEAMLLNCLVINRGVLQTRSQLLKTIWGTIDNVSPGVLNVYVNKLRKKLGPYSWTIITRSGWGYLFDDLAPKPTVPTAHN